MMEDTDFEEVVEQNLQGIKDIDPDIPLKAGNKVTATKAASILSQEDSRFVVPTATQRKVLLIEFAKAGKVIYGQAFDIVKIDGHYNLDEMQSVGKGIKQKKITICEIKATNRDNVSDDFGDYFFSLSTAELLVAQSVKDAYRFVFVNIKTRKFLELTLAKVYAKTQAIYPSWSIRFRK